ncbi:uncharacterized protein LOC130625589 isoform X2 [Hydractinia symbiolongicarpus]|uniref:uncharacterized protein LOC130625589 isoform X2 n=1 Tax=Hydractinia symbiolongicarpus TaxID=13093 RepID=UPI002550A077|nr:uncharacterized protein LOC130625589 isoform X2 [Hydractinia symbiolongicarpus]
MIYCKKMIMKAALLYQLLFLVKSQIQLVPVQFVTKESIVSHASDVNQFNLRLCGGDLYNHQHATVNLILPMQPWSPAIGVYLRANVYDANNHLLADNKDGKGSFVDKFTFPYYKTYGDLLINITTAPTPSITYRIVVNFEKNVTMEQNKSMFPIKRKAYNMEQSTVHIKQPITGHTSDLVSIFLTSGTINTAESTLLELSYCINPAELPGYVDINIVSVDKLSGFATFACPASVRPCTTETAKFFDVSGLPINFVRVFMTHSTDAGPVQLIVIGYGKYEGTNKFLLDASEFKRQT